MKTNKYTSALFFTAVAALTVGAFLSNADFSKTTLKMRANLTQYHFIKTDFHLETAPVIPSGKVIGNSTFSLVEDSGIFTTTAGMDTNYIDWSHYESNGFVFVNSGIFGFASTEKNYEDDTNRRLEMKLTIDVQGEREITNLGTNTYFLFDIYYHNDDESYNDVIREYKATPTYAVENSSIEYLLNTDTSEFNYNIPGYSFISWDVYKVVLKTVSVEYSCSN